MGIYKMSTKERSKQELAIDEATTIDTIRDAELSTAEIVYPNKNKKIVLKIDIEEKTFESCKKIANKKHFSDYSKLINQYIREGVEKDEKLLT